MSRRRWIIGGVAAAAALLLVGRVVAGWYVEYLWYDALGASEVWRARTIDLFLLRGGAFIVGSLFVFANLYAVRHSVVSLVLPRRVANIEIGEEVPSRYLLAVVVAMSLVIGLLLALPHGDWISLELVRHGEAFRESDPYFQFDMAFWVYWLPLETAIHLWSLIALLAITLVIAFLYALTPSLRWEGGRLRVSGYVRRHFFALGGALLVLLGWSYRLDAYRLLLDGSGAQGTFNALDHRVGIPANLVLALATIAAAMLFLWAGWMGQLRLAFATVSAALLLALTLRQFLPPIAERFLTPSNHEDRDRPYHETRAGYTRRAYDIDRVARPDSTEPGPSLASAMHGTSLWDAVALERAVARERRSGRPSGPPGWEVQDGRLRALFVEEPVGPDAADPLAPWSLTRVDADITTDQGTPALTSSPGAGETFLPPAIVYDSAPGYSVVIDSIGRIAAPTLDPIISRIAYAWGLQNPRLLSSDVPRDRARVVLHRDIRGRVERIFPFFSQGARIAPLMYRDSLYWSLHLYSASAFYPLSDPVRVGDDDVRYFQHAAVAIVNAHTGRVFAVADPMPDPIASSWIRRFPRLFVTSSAIGRNLAERIAPPVEAALVHARVFARVGPRGEFAPPSHLPRQHGGDTLFAYPTYAPFVDSGGSGRLALAYPVLNASDRVRGVMVAGGGGAYEVRWAPFDTVGQRWARIIDRLHRAIDSTGLAGSPREAPLIRGPVRVVPFDRTAAYVQTAYSWRADGAPTVRLVAVLIGDSVRTGLTVAAAAGLPAPTLPATPLSAEEFRSRVDALYAEMRVAMRRGDWVAFGAAFEALGRVLRSAPRKP